MQQYRRWLAFTALWVILIDSHAKEKFSKSLTLTRVIKSSETKLYSFPSEVHDQSNDGCIKFPGHSRDQVKSEVIKDANVKVFSFDVKHDQKSSQLNKSQVNKLGKINGSIFSYLTGHKSTTVDVGRSTNDRLRMNTLTPEKRNHINCPELLRKLSRISERLLLKHIEYTKKKVKRNIYEQTEENNNIDIETQQNNKRLYINRKWKIFQSDNPTEKCITKNISMEDQLIKFNELNDNKNIVKKTIINEGEKNLVVLRNEIKTKDLQKHPQSTFVDKDSERILMKTSELTPEIQLDLFTKLLRVKPQTRLTNEKSESNNQQLQVEPFFRSNRPYLIKRETTFPRITSLKKHHVQFKNIQHSLINPVNENDGKKFLFGNKKKLSFKTQLPFYTKEIKGNPESIFNEEEDQNSQLILDDKLNKVEEVNMAKTLKDQQGKSEKWSNDDVVRVKKDISLSNITLNVENTLDRVSSVIPVVHKEDSTKFNSTWGSSTEIVLLNENYNAILASHLRKVESTSRQHRNSTSAPTIQVPEKMISLAKLYSEDHHLNVPGIESIATDISFPDVIQTDKTTTTRHKEFISSSNLTKTNTTTVSERSFWNPLEESWRSSVKPQQVRSSSMSTLPTDIPEVGINTPGWSEDHITAEVLGKIQRIKIDRNLGNVTLIALEDYDDESNDDYMHNKSSNVNQLLDPLRRSESLSERSKTGILKMEIELSSRSRNTSETTPKGNTNRGVKKSKLSTHSQTVSEKWGKVKPMWDANDTETDVLPDTDSRSIALFTKLANRISRPITGENGFTTNRDIQTSDHVDHENASLITSNQWPVKHSAVVEGDLVLGGLMMVHEREDTITCGPIMPQGGIQALEAMLYTLDWLNKREIVPGVKIGAHILDDCDKDTYGLEMAVDFIKGSISNIDGAEYSCNKSTVRKVISGVVGAASSVTSIQVANLLRLFRIPQVSFFSTSPELSNKQRFEYFTRTIPSDHYQVKAMVDIIRKMGWSYVSIIYEESNYGIKAYEELEELLAKNQICIAIKEKLVKDSGVAEETAYDNIVQKLLTKPRARGCIIFGSDQEVAGMMRAVRRNNATGAFYWIGSDGWSARGLVSNKNEPEVEGTLSVQPQANSVEGFEQYFLNLTVENNRRNPWFVEFWEDHFQCRYPNASRTPYNQKYKISCTKKERLTKQNTAFEDQLQFVSDAVMAFAYAFRDMHADLCHGQPGLCDAMKPTKGTELLKYLKKVEFQGLSGDEFHFDKNGDGPARYNIIHFKQVSPGEYKWIRVGKYLEGELVLNMSEIQFRLDNPEPPESVCSLPCRVGQAKKYVEGESCCWHCLDCTQYQIRHTTDQTRCVQCPQGTVPDETHSYCRDIPEEFLKFDSGWAIGAMSFSASGILVTLFVGGVFVKYNDTPIVRASGRELSYVLLTGILLCYLVTFTLILKPTDLVCGIQRFAAGFCFTVVYAALLTKTNRISRIFNKSKKSAKRPSFISPRSQLIICSLLVGVQILINAVWMVIDPAKARHHYPTREDNLLVCNSYIDASYMIAFTYPIILIVVCTVYAVLTRKIPEDFNESKHIGFTMYTTCVIWLAFVPLYFGTGNHVALRITSMSVTISLSASVTIACLFSPKLYIILIHPERNIRRGRGPFALKHSTVARTNASSMISTVTLTAATCDQNKAVKGQTISTIDCSTQSELLEMEVKDFKNGKLPVTLTSRATQTVSNNNEKETNVPLSTSNDQSNTDTIEASKSLNNKKISNGPISKNDITS